MLTAQHSKDAAKKEHMLCRNTLAPNVRGNASKAAAVGQFKKADEKHVHVKKAVVSFKR